jgi:hypothetical protein
VSVKDSMPLEKRGNGNEPKTRLFCKFLHSKGCQKQMRYWHCNSLKSWVWEEKGEHTCQLVSKAEFDENEPCVQKLTTDTKEVIKMVMKEHDYSLTPARYRYILLTKDLVNPQDVPLKFVQSFVYSHLLTLRAASADLPNPKKVDKAAIYTWCMKGYDPLNKWQTFGQDDLLVLNPPEEWFDDSNGDICIVVSTKRLLSSAQMAMQHGCDVLACDHTFNLTCHGIPFATMGIPDYLHRIWPLSFQFAHRKTKEVLASYARHTQTAIYELYGIRPQWRFGLSDGCSSLQWMWANCFDRILEWISCYWHVLHLFDKLHVDRATRRLLVDLLSSLHFCQYPFQLEAAWELLEQHWSALAPGVDIKPFRNLDWVQLLHRLGRPRTNNSLENFQRLIKQLLQLGHAAPLLDFLCRLGPFLQFLSREACCRQFPAHPLDVLDQSGRVRPSVNRDIITRLRKLWSKAQELARNFANGHTYTVVVPSGYYWLNGATTQCLQALPRTEQVYYREILLPAALAESRELSLLNTPAAVRSYVNRMSVWQANPLQLVASMSGQNLEAPFQLYIFGLRLFYVVCGVYCTCPYSKQYGICKHILAVRIFQTFGACVPPVFDVSPVRNMSSNKRRKTNNTAPLTFQPTPTLQPTTPLLPPSPSTSPPPPPPPPPRPPPPPPPPSRRPSMSSCLSSDSEQDPGCAIIDDALLLASSSEDEGMHQECKDFGKLYHAWMSRHGDCIYEQPGVPQGPVHRPTSPPGVPGVVMPIGGGPARPANSGSVARSTVARMRTGGTPAKPAKPKPSPRRSPFRWLSYRKHHGWGGQRKH